ncbi:MAG: hypothetical protein ACXACH_06405, partial [Candidatus Hermodarchaeia archaeon]
ATVPFTLAGLILMVGFIAIVFSVLLLFKYREMDRQIRTGYLIYAKGTWINLLLLYYAYIPFAS